jgi:hypothetical protein
MFHSKKKIKEDIAPKDLRHTQTMQQIAAYANSKELNKREVVSLVADIYEKKELEAFGFKLSSVSFTNARKHGKKYGFGASLPSKQIPPSKRKKNNDEIENFLINNCQRSPNETRKVNGEDVPAFYFEAPVSHLHHSFCQSHPESKMSLSCFSKNIPKNFITSRHYTDVCETCLKGKALEK